MTALTVFFSNGNRSGLRSLARLWVIVGLLSLGTACAAQEEVFDARLSPFPVIGGTAAGSGSATATLRGTTLEVTGTFEGLTYRAGRGGEVAQASAASAQLFAGPVTAVSGDRFADLTLTADGPGDAGTISGSAELTSEQVEMLRNGQIYAQVGSEESPDGHLWGWFLQ